MLDQIRMFARLTTIISVQSFESSRAGMLTGRVFENYHPMDHGETNGAGNADTGS